jgi:hypothetical protein
MISFFFSSGKDIESFAIDWKHSQKHVGASISIESNNFKIMWQVEKPAAAIIELLLPTHLGIMSADKKIAVLLIQDTLSEV